MSKKLNIEDEILNLREVAGLLKVHCKTAERWRKTKAMPYIDLMGSIRYSKIDILTWINIRKQ